MKEGHKCFLKYRYPYFSDQAAVVTKPLISPVFGEEHHFSGTLSTFRFACGISSLVHHLQYDPLSLEVWTSGEKVDNLVGVAKVPLGEVFNGKKFTSGSSVCQRCSLKVPVLALLSRTICAQVYCTLMLEDERNGVDYQSLHTEVTPGANEYLTAMELEMWKLSQEEMFMENMKTKEIAYLQKLREEWIKREEERQRLFMKKVETYHSLEKQLRSALEATQCQQAKLLNRETELQQLHNKIVLEVKNVSRSCEAKIQQCQLINEGKTGAQRERADELLHSMEKQKSQVSCIVCIVYSCA
jgi:hypothetical protein